MADVVGTLLSIAELSGNVYLYLEAIKHANKDRDLMKSEIDAAGTVITTLLELANGASSNADWLPQLQTITSPGSNGEPSHVSRYERLLLDIIEKLEPSGTGSTSRNVLRFRKLAHNVKWPFTKDEVENMAKHLHRLQQSFQSVLQAVQIKLWSGVKDSVDVQGHEIVNRLCRIQSGQEELLHSKGEEEFMEHCLWLSTMRTSSQVDALLRDIDEKTRPAWIFRDSKFHMWRKRPSSIPSRKLGSRVLWAYGNPGAGKSVLAAVVAKKLQSESRSSSTRICVATFFFRYFEKVTVESVLRCVARQLLEQARRDFLPVVKEAKTKEATAAHGTFRVEELLCSMWARFDRAFLVIDALDECHDEQRHETMSVLKSLLERNPSLQLMVTSRGDMQMYFSEKMYLSPAWQVSVAAQEENIKAYVQMRIQQISEQPEVALFDSSPETRNEIAEKVIQHSVGVFLLAVRHINALGECLKQFTLETTVSNLSSDLGQTVQNAIERIRGQNNDLQSLGMRALLWVANAFRPLIIDELQGALATYECADEDDLDERHLSKEINILRATKGLISMDPVSRELTIHQSISEHLRRNAAEIFGADHEVELARIILKYLCFSRFAGGELDGHDIYKRLSRNRFLFYAAKYWERHIGSRSPETAVKLKDDIAKFICSEGQLQCANQTRDMQRINKWKESGNSGPKDAVELKVHFCCEKCMGLMQTAINQVDGVDSVDCNYTAGIVTVTGLDQPEQILAVAKKAGSRAALVRRRIDARN